MCLKQSKQEKMKADKSGSIGASSRENTSIENKGPLYWKWT